MKSLTKLRLINWHYFANTTTDIKNITFLTGPNGTGKSTIIDALQILILGSTRPDNFNKAANEKGRSGRSLLSYLRGQTGVSDDGSVINLRSGSFSSYLAIEITDDVENRVFTLGVVFDVDDADSIDKHYFYLDSPFPKNDFANSDSEPNPKKVRPMRYRELSSYVRGAYKPGHFRFFESDVEYEAFTKEAFGNLPDKYFSLFRKAVSFAPISDISSFITEYVCDADINVDISPMQKNIEQYKILEIEAKNLKNKVDSLNAIQVAFDSLRSHEKKMELLTYVNARSNYEESLRKLGSLNDTLAKDNSRLAAIANDLETFDKQLADLNADLASYQAKKLQSSNYSLTEKLSMKKDGITQKITAIQMAIQGAMNKLGIYADDYQKTCQDFYDYYSSLNPDRLGEKVSKVFTEYLEFVKDVAGEAKALGGSVRQNAVDFAAVKAFRNDMDSLRTQTASINAILTNAFQEASDTLQSQQSDLTAVNAGKKPFDKLGPDYLTIKNSLETALKGRHSDAYVHIYCDLVDSNDPEWTLALEAVLYAQKFNFFVNPAYYEEANRLLKEMCDNYHYYRVSLVDTERLLSAHLRADEGSIAELIDTDDSGARAYTDYLLGRIRKCTTFEEARDSGSGLLSDCTGYRGYATWYLNKDHARIFYLGRQVSSNAKAMSAHDYQETNRLYSVLSELLNKLRNISSLPLMSEAECQNYESDVGRATEIANLQKDIDNVNSEMKDATLGDMADVEKKIDSLKADIATVTHDETDRYTERGSLLAEVQHLNGFDIPDAQRNADTFKAQLVGFSPDTVNKEYDPFYSKLVDTQGMTLAQIRSEAGKEYIQEANKQRADKDNLIKLRSDYCSLYHLNYSVSDEKDNSEFSKELENISKVMLPDYEKKITDAHVSSIKEFKDDFIYKLRTAIETVNAQIDELNKALAESRFGRDTYQFKVSPNKDYLEYYNMIMDPLLLKAGDAESLFMEKYKTTMDDLFGLISSSTSATGEQREQILQNVETFTSYTTYLLFDLLVTRGEGESQQTISLGKSFRSQSGGETQTPFYIAILASFASLTRAKNAKDNNTLRLVIFDEAFSKMDSARIMKSTDLLREFGLQAILSTPSEKLRDLVNYVDLILVTIHDEKRKRSGLDVYEEKKKAEEAKTVAPEVLAAQVKEATLPPAEEKKGKPKKK
jgi:energy-coupling factor transporter ATP-binding protein EcfA2